MTCLACGTASELRPICRACWKRAPRSYKRDVLAAERGGLPTGPFYLAVAEVVRMKVAQAPGASRGRA